MKINITKESGIVVVAVDGKIDFATSPQLQESFDRLLAKGEHNYVVDMAGVGFVDSPGLLAFVRLFKRVRTGNGEVKLCSMTPEVLHTFELTRLNKVFPIFETVAAAVESFR